MNPLKKISDVDCGIVCRGFHCRFMHDVDSGVDLGQPAGRVCCPQEWQVTLNYPGRYNHE